MVIDNLECTLV